MTHAELARLRALCEAATGGAWIATPYTGATPMETDWQVDAPGSCVANCAESDSPDADAHFIAAARKALPALLDEVQRRIEESAAHAEVCVALDTEKTDRIAELEAALRKYGRHTENGCGRPHRTHDGEEPVRIWYDPCECGLDAALDGKELK